jgi:hypothetical protein
MESEIIVFWQVGKEQRAIIGIYKELSILEKWFARTLILNLSTDRSIVKMFRNKKAVRIASVKVSFEDEKAE